MTEKILRANGEGLRKQKQAPLVYVRYLDHVLFKDVDPGAFSRPFTRETIGWLDHEDDHCIRIVWERFAGVDPQEKMKQKATGLLIMKSSILELRRIG